MTYSLSADLFRSINENDFSEILFPFAYCRRPDIKVAIDKKEAIIERYKNNISPFFKEMFTCWLLLMSNNRTTSFCIIDVDLSEVPNEEYCLKVAASINGRKQLIVKSYQEFKYPLSDDYYVMYDGAKIHVIEKETAKIEIDNCRPSVTNVSISNGNNNDVYINSNNKTMI